MAADLHLKPIFTLMVNFFFAVEERGKTGMIICLDELSKLREINEKQ